MTHMPDRLPQTAGTPVRADMQCRRSCMSCSALLLCRLRVPAWGGDFRGGQTYRGQYAAPWPGEISALILFTPQLRAGAAAAKGS